MLLTKELLDAVKGYTANMNNAITLVLQQGEHAKRAELVEFLESLCSVSDQLKFEERDIQARSPISFSLERDGEPLHITFSGIPGGHEFNSLILAILQASGTALKLDDHIQKIIKRIDEPLNFVTYISLSCHNCPDVVQALNQFALLNLNISSEMIDGGLFPELIEENNIQGVPSVYLNDEVFANGKIDTAVLLEKLTELYPSILEASTDDGPSLPQQDVTVIGGGPAGVSAAIYSARKGLKVTLIADRIGGQVKDTMGIENFISVAYTTGPELTGALIEHMKKYEITIKEHVSVDSVEKGDIKKIHLSTGEVIETRSLIIATGAKWRELNVPGEKENIGNGVAYCPHCDGPFFKGKDVIVVGGGNSGIEAALDLAGIVKSVTVLEFLPELKADQVLIDKANSAKNISIIKNVATQQILAENGSVTALEYQDRETGENHTIDIAAVFIQIGLIPNSSFLEGVVELSQYKEIVINERCETNEPGIFACGDVTTVPYKQIVIAMGEGSKAALSAFEYLLLGGD